MELTQKGEMVSRLQAKAGQIGKILNNLEKYNHLAKDQKMFDKKHSKSDMKQEHQKKIQHNTQKVEADAENLQLKTETGDSNG